METKASHLVIWELEDAYRGGMEGVSTAAAGDHRIKRSAARTAAVDANRAARSIVSMSKKGGMTI
jgi:hypothetical protein